MQGKSQVFIIFDEHGRIHNNLSLWDLGHGLSGSWATKAHPFFKISEGLDLASHILLLVTSKCSIIMTMEMLPGCAYARIAANACTCARTHRAKFSHICIPTCPTWNKSSPSSLTKSPPFSGPGGDFPLSDEFLAASLGKRTPYFLPNFYVLRVWPWEYSKFSTVLGG